MVEVSIYDVFNVSIAILNNFLFFLFSSFFFFVLIPSFHSSTVFVSFNFILFFIYKKKKSK